MAVLLAFALVYGPEAPLVFASTQSNDALNQQPVQAALPDDKGNPNLDCAPPPVASAPD
jgi:hypothetical protein